jgi:hypothetical protein
MKRRKERKCPMGCGFIDRSGNMSLHLAKEHGRASTDFSRYGTGERSSL